MALTPAQIAKAGTEHAHQSAYFAWMTYNIPLIRAVSFAIPNGAKLGTDERLRMIQGGRLKAEGLTSGVPDTMTAYPIAPYHGFFMEMKKPTVGVVSLEQTSMAQRLVANGYHCVVCYHWITAVRELCKYLHVNVVLLPEHEEMKVIVHGTV